MLGSSSSDGVWGNLGNTQGYRKPPIASPSVDRGVGPAHHRCCESTAGTRRSFGGFGSSVPLDLTMSLRVEPYTHTHTHTHFNAEPHPIGATDPTPVEEKTRQGTARHRAPRPLHQRPNGFVLDSVGCYQWYTDRVITGYRVVFINRTSRDWNYWTSTHCYNIYDVHSGVVIYLCVSRIAVPVEAVLWRVPNIRR